MFLVVAFAFLVVAFAFLLVAFAFLLVAFAFLVVCETSEEGGREGGEETGNIGIIYYDTIVCSDEIHERTETSVGRRNRDDLLAVDV